MSIELVSVIASVLASSTAASAVAEHLFRFLQKRLQDKDVKVERIEDLGALEVIEKELSSHVTRKEEEEITNSALAEAHAATNALRSERMRQARVAFNAAVILLVVGVLIILGGISLMLFQNATIGGSVTTAVGAVIEVISALLFRFNSETNNRVDEIGRYLNTIEAAQVAMKLISKIEDVSKRDDAIRETARDLARFVTRGGSPLK